MFIDSVLGFSREHCDGCSNNKYVKIELTNSTVKMTDDWEDTYVFKRESFAPDREYWINNSWRYTVTLNNGGLKHPLIYLVDSIVTFLPQQKAIIQSPGGQIVLVTDDLDGGFFDIHSFAIPWVEVITDFKRTENQVIFFNVSKGVEVILNREYSTDGSQKWVRPDGYEYYIVRRKY